MARKSGSLVGSSNAWPRVARNEAPQRDFAYRLETLTGAGDLAHSFKDSYLILCYN